MNTMDAIQNRISVRRYSNIAVDDFNREELERFMLSGAEGLFGTKPRFKMLNPKSLSRDEQKELGTFGFIKGA